MNNNSINSNLNSLKNEFTIYKNKENTEEVKKDNIIEKKTNFVKETFLFSCVFLFGTTLITFIEAMKTKSENARHILNIETAVSLIAGYVYSIFLTMVNDKNFDLKNITKIRYMDWAITTPFLLLALTLFFTYYKKKNPSLSQFLIVIFFNYLMLIFGYLGETQQIAKNTGGILGFIAFIAMLFFLWNYFVKHDDFRHQKTIFFVFAGIWTLYGVAYYLSDEDKNIMYNFLDVISKSGFGLFMWLYFGKVFEL